MDEPEPQITAGLGDTEPAVGVPEHNAAVIVWLLEDATGSVPVSVAEQIVNPVKAVEASAIVLPPVAVPSTSTVIWIYAVVPAAIVCGVNDGKVLLPGPPGELNVESNVEEPVLNVEDVEYQHLYAFTSVPVWVPVVAIVSPDRLASAAVTARLKVCNR